MRYAAITLVTLAAFLTANTADAQIAWESKLLDAHARAKAEGKLMLLHFYTDNCVYCDRLEAGAFRSAQLASNVNDHFVALRVHGGKNQRLAKKFGVEKYPTDVIVTIDGKVVSKSVSPQQSDRYIAMLTSARADFSRRQTMIAASNDTAPVETTPSKPSYASELAVQVPGPKPGEKTMQSNQFVMPSATAGGTTASLASARPSMTTPPGVQEDPAESSAALTRPDEIAMPSDLAKKPELALQGFCPISVVDRMEWVDGNPELGVVHLGKLYLFADQASMDTFLADPIPYTPVLNGIDVVRFFEEKKIVPGKREWGSVDPIHNRMFFFADEAAMNHFEDKYQNYVDAAVQVMDQAIKESNPAAR
ncbi:MAG: thioredoxin fold domain-containing protein [Planctomycetota bacterium]